MLPIKTERLIIREFDESMAESVCKNSLDEDNRRFVPDEVFNTVEEAREIIHRLKEFYLKKDSPLVYAVTLHDGRHIGHVQAVPYYGDWEAGYHIAKDFTGNGYATEALAAFLPPILERIGISRIYGICRADNIASRRVLEKCGFFLEFCGEGRYHGETHKICRYMFSAPCPI